MTHLITAAGRRTGIVLFAALLCVFAALGPAAPASAHASLVSTDPEDGANVADAPSSVTLEFSESVSVGASGVRVFAAAGEPITVEAAAVDSTVTAALPELATDARYVIAWQVISGDGHPISGTIAFSVGDPPAGGQPQVDVSDDGAVAGWADAASALQLLGLLVAAGMMLFERTALRGSIGTRPARIAIVIASTTGAIGAIAVAAFAAARSGSPTWTTIAGAALAVGSALLVWTRSRPRPSPAGTGLAAVGLAVALAALASPVLVGHSASKEPRWLIVASDLIHLGAGAVWFGGVVGLGFFLIAARRPEAAEASTGGARSATDVIARFSIIAAGSAGALLVTGVIMAVVILGEWDAVLGTAYGRLLLLKLGFVAIALAIAAWTRVRIVPAIASRPDRPAGWVLLRGQVLREAVMIAAIVAVTGVLIGQSPSIQHGSDAAATTAVAGTADGLALSGRLETAGDTASITVVIVDDDGVPIEPIEPPTMSARLPAQELGPITTAAVATGTPGEYTAELDLPVSGEWTVDIGIRLSAFEQRTVRITTTIQ